MDRSFCHVDVLSESMSRSMVKFPDVPAVPVIRQVRIIGRNGHRNGIEHKRKCQGTVVNTPVDF